MANGKFTAKERKFINEYVKCLGVQAKEKGEFYFVKDYFNDLKKIDLFRADLYSKYSANPLYSSSDPGQLLYLSQQNHDDENIDLLRQEYKDWRRNLFPNFRYHSEKNDWKKVFCRTIAWLKMFFVRGMILSLFLYLIRMFNYRGISHTVLADKKKFLLALIFWPLFLTKYPFNVIREIRVEVELRRMGNIFRRLSSRE